MTIHTLERRVIPGARLMVAGLFQEWDLFLNLQISRICSFITVGFRYKGPRYKGLLA